MYGLEQVKKGLRNPKKVLGELVTLHGRAANRLFDGNHGEYVLDRDWDNLIVLDACRYDLFAECNTIEGELEKFRSRGSHTGEYMEQNFAGGQFPDVVYVSANPNPASVDAEFAAVEEVWDSGWDDDLHTVPPDVLVERTLETAEQYPNKRIISHFLQPHYPWIGPEGRAFMDEYGYVSQYGGNDHLWLQLERGELDHDRLWEVYRENLEVILPYIRYLSKRLDGKTVITSDHGNAFGEYGVYGHPARHYTPQLVTVPWLRLPFTERKEIVPVDSLDRFDTENINKEQLEDLGYIG